MWRNQMRQPWLSATPLRRLSDKATSSGDLNCRTGRTDQSASSNTEDQKGMSRHMRGSLTIARLASPNSSASADFARACRATLAVASIRPGSNSTPIPPTASSGGENLVIQTHKDRRLPKAPWVVLLRRHQIDRSGAAEPDQRPRHARSAAAMHTQDQNGGPGRAFECFAILAIELHIQVCASASNSKLDDRSPSSFGMSPRSKRAKRIAAISRGPIL